MKFLNQLLLEEDDAPDAAQTRKDALAVSYDLLVVGVQGPDAELMMAASASVASILRLMEVAEERERRVVRPDFGVLRRLTEGGGL